MQYHLFILFWEPPKLITWDLLIRQYIIITGVNTKPNGNKFGQRPFDRNTLGRGKFDRGNVYKCGRDKCDS